MVPRAAGASWREAVDSFLEATVLLSWSNIGYHARQLMWGWSPGLPAGSMAGRNVVITGGTSGIGKAAAAELVRAGARVCLVGRNPVRAERAAEEVSRAACREGPPGRLQLPGAPKERSRAGGAWPETADMASLSEVRALAKRISDSIGDLGALVHGAGGILKRYETVESSSSIERTVATNVVGPHLLTALLQPLLAAGAPSVVVWVSSGGAYLQPLAVDLLRDVPQPYRGTAVYARAKRAQVALARQWALRTASQGISGVAMHPGWAATPALSSGLPKFAKLSGPVLRTPPQGADTVSWLVAGQAGQRPKVAFWLDRSPRPEHKATFSFYPPQEEDRLWDWCCELTGAPGRAPREDAP